MNSGIWSLFSNKTLLSEFGPNSPSKVDAADYDRSQNNVFLIDGNTVYQYDTSGKPPSLSYTFTDSYIFNENSANNPFSAGVSSVLSTPPALPHALVMLPNVTIVLAGNFVYSCDRATNNWQQEGPIPCT